MPIKMNSDTANKMVKQLTIERNRLMAQERESSTYAYLHGETPYVPEYNFRETQDAIEDINKKIVTIKHAINQFNATTKSDATGLTVDAMLVRLPMVSAQKEKLARMHSMLEKTRSINLGSKSSEYTVRNFSAQEAKEEYDKVSKELILLQQELNRINLTMEFEVSP